MFNFYFANNGKILILISENNLIFNTELKKYTHPTSLVLNKKQFLLNEDFYIDF